MFLRDINKDIPKALKSLKISFIMAPKIELLAPAGDFECLVTAINAGADAVYFGITDFNMRARTKNFQLIDLPKVAKLCKLRKIKKYLTINTIVYDNELKMAENIIKKSKPFIDAIICSDISVMLLCKKYKVDFFISTQCSISNSKTAEFFKKLGAKRIVLARELNLNQIKKISKIIPTEIFIHGAMCVSVSGRCFLSEHLYKQSANRGRCIQPCRRYYNVKDDQDKELRVSNHHIFSAKDLCTLPFIEKLKKSGVTSFKIEGRSREPEYIDAVVKAYRKALDKKLTKQEIEDLLKELSKVYTKGFSSGFYLGTPTSDDFSEVQNSKATHTKQFIGKIKHYYSNIGVGILKLNTGKLKVGDDIFIIGKTTGLIKYKIESMQINHKEVQEVKKSEEVGIKLPFCRKGDEIYKVVKR